MLSVPGATNSPAEFCSRTTDIPDLASSDVVDNAITLRNPGFCAGSRFGTVGRPGCSGGTGDCVNGQAVISTSAPWAHEFDDCAHIACGEKPVHSPCLSGSTH